MILNNTEINDLVSNKFEIDCSSIILIQQIDTNPIIYTGAGTIFQDDKGLLNLKMVSEVDNIQREVSHSPTQLQLGKIINRDYFFKLEAIGVDGKKWNAENISGSGHLFISTGKKVIKSRIRKIFSEITFDSDASKNGSSCSMISTIIIEKLKFPLKAKQEGVNGRIAFNKTEWKLDSTTVKITQKDNYYKLFIDEIKGDPEVFKILFFEALSIVFGKIIEPLSTTILKNGKHRVTIQSIDKGVSNEAINTPFGVSEAYGEDSLIEFLNKYILNIKSESSVIFGYWHKIHRVWQVGVENSALTISVAIEGVLKEYFSNLGLPDTEILEQAELAKQEIKLLKLPDRIRQRLLSNLGNLKSTNPKNILHQLACNSTISKELIGEWTSLRSKSTHADKVDLNNESMQILIDQVYTNIFLFYSLLFEIIDYEGYCIDYTVNNWPERLFRPHNLRNQKRVDRNENRS